MSPAKVMVLRTLGFTATGAIAISNMVGQGVFLKARVMTCNVGSPTLMITAWVVAGLLALCGALTVAELGAAIPESGGLYAFFRRAYGRSVAFAYGWETVFVGGPAATAALAAGSAIFFNAAGRHVLEGFLWTSGIAGVTVTLTGLQVFAAAVIVLVSLLNLAPAFINGQIASASALLKILMLIAVTCVAFVFGHGSAAHFAQSGAGGACQGVSSAARFGVPGFAAALIGALYAYQGWQSATLVVAEVRDPRREFPIALVASVAIVIVGYVLTNVAFVDVLGPLAIANLPAGSSVGVSVIETIFGSGLRVVAAALLFVSVLATLHVTVLSNVRVSYALAQDGKGFQLLGRLSQRARVPVNAIIANAIISIVLVLLGTFDTLSDYFIFNAWVFFAAAGGAVFLLRAREPALERPFRAPGYPIVPAIFVLVAILLLVQTLFTNPRNSAIGLSIVAISFPYYAWQRRRELRKAPTSV